MLRYIVELGVQVTGGHPFDLQAKLEDKYKKLTHTALAGFPLRCLLSIFFRTKFCRLFFPLSVYPEKLFVMTSK